MRKLIFLIYSTVLFCIGQNKPPYEAIWLEIKETDNGYVVYNYPNWNDETIKSPNKTIIEKNSLIDISFSDGAVEFVLDTIKNLGNGVYVFTVKDHDSYKFEWFFQDKKKHIARWKFLYKGEIMRDKLYIDSLYNPYPIIDFEWSDLPKNDD